MHNGVKVKELREETPLGIKSVKQWKHILEERKRNEAGEKRKGDLLVKQRGAGGKGDCARRERDEDAAAFV